MITKIRLMLFLKGISITSIAQAAGVSVSYAARCINGKEKPSAKVRKALKDIAGIEFDDA